MRIEKKVRLLLKSSLLFLVSCTFGRLNQKSVKIHGLYSRNYGSSNTFHIQLDSSGRYLFCNYEGRILLLHSGKYRADSVRIILQDFAVRKYRNWIYSKDSLVLNRDRKLILWYDYNQTKPKDSVRHEGIKKFNKRKKKYQNIYDQW